MQQPSSRSGRLVSHCLPFLFLVACTAHGDEQGTAEEESLGQTSAALVDVSDFGANPAQLTMHKYIPADMPATPRPLVVALHGCTQTAAAYESAGWGTLADEWKFYVVYPEQNSQRNNSSGCFNWGGRWKSAPSSFVLSPEALELDEIARGHGENESIKEMVDKMKADHTIDDKRVFITGLSAGGGMAALMLAVWPDVFAGGAIFAGIPYGCATNKKTTDEAAACTKDYTGANAYLARTPQQWGDLVRAAAPSFKGPYPRVSIWQGTADSIVNFANSEQLMKQWTDVNGIDQTPDVDAPVETFPHKEYKDASGKTLVETYAITGQSHGTEIAPNAPMDPAQPNGGKCGKPGAYILSTSICSTYYAGKFLGLDLAAGAADADAGSTGGPSSSSSTGGTGGANGTSGTNGAAPGKSGSKGIPSTCGIGRGSGSSSAPGLAAVAAVFALVSRRRKLRRTA